VGAGCGVKYFLLQAQIPEVITAATMIKGLESKQLIE